MVLVVGLMQAQIDIGFRSGPTFNTIYQSQSLDAVTPDLDYLIGFSGGVYADIPLSSQLSFQPELAYSQKGFSLAQGADIDLLSMFPVSSNSFSVIRLCSKKMRF